MAEVINWYVAGDARSGDGSREKPFHDLWLALRSASPDDIIHVAGGTYFGRYDRSSWLIDCPELTILGGYSRDFTTRTPWKTPSVFAMFPGYEAPRENNMIGWRGDPAGLTLDGLFFDAAGANLYDASGGLQSHPTMSGPIASFNAARVTIRNCVFANGANGGVELSGEGSRFENNLVLNLIGLAMLDLRSSAQPISQPILVRNNSFCFMHDTGAPPGGGGDSAIGVRIGCPASVEDNVFVGCGNAAISFYLDAGRVSIEHNLFYLTPRDLVKSRALGNTGEIGEKNLEEMEDLGFKSAVENAVQDPGMSGVRTEWLDAYTRQLIATYARPPRETANVLRVEAGLPAVSAADLEKPESTGALAPRFSPSEGLALAFAVTQGFHTVETEVKIGGRTVQPAPTYRAVDWNAMLTPDPALANMRVALRAGLGTGQNMTLLTDLTVETHLGLRIYQPGSDDVWLYVLMPRNTLAARQLDDAIIYQRGLDVEKTYLVQGIYRSDVQSTRQKTTLVVESIGPAPVLSPKTGTRPEGRDWFVRAGASAGDGTREKPFRDPFQALEKAEGGDAIHVAAGSYFGKLRSGKWTIAIRNLTLLGGYDAEFATRDPWKNATRFLLNEEEKAKGRPGGPILDSESNSEGLILDGFIFDGATWNTYSAKGDLDMDNSPLAPLIQLGGGRDRIVVRNCVFVNGSSGAVILSCPFGAFENNVVVNNSGCSLSFRADGPGPATIRDNTFLFAGDPTPRAGTGKSNPDGSLVLLTGRAEVDVGANIFAFGDNYGVRSTLPQQNVSFENNVFAANLFNQLTDDGYLWADSATWERRAVADSAFAKFSGNTLELPKLPVDPAFADIALRRLFGLPSRISEEEWKTFAAQIGSTAIPLKAPAAASASATSAAADSGSALSKLLSSLNKPAEPKKQEEAPKASEPAYCPLFDWVKALALVQETPETEPGAHRLKLDVMTFRTLQERPAVKYTRITPQDIDASRASLDQKPVELDVTDARDSSSNPSLYPEGMGKNDCMALSVSAVGGETRTRLALVIRLDTAAGKAMQRMNSRDRMRVRGTAYTKPESSFLSIVVDQAEPV